VLQKTPFSFDVSVWELFWPLLAGAGLVVARPGGHQDSAYLVATVRRERVTTLHFVPSMLQVFIEDPAVGACTSLRRVIASGEALPPDLVARCGERLAAPLHNLYGPTEAAIDVTWWPCPGGGTRPASVPIGRPVANTHVHVVDRRQRPAPTGAPGEMVLGGVQIAAGYLGRPGLTAERFTPDPFAAEGTAGARLYRTGDLARRRPDGAVEYLGRLDHQVKLRGFRIELGEIEAALAARTEVRETVVLLRTDVAGGPALVAYVVPAGPEPDPEALGARLSAALAAELPEYMVPGTVVVLEALPLSPNGKVDRKALPAPAAGPTREGEPAVPRTALERHLAGLFRDVLGAGAPEVGIRDDFFSLGGNSIAGAVLINRLQEELGEIVHVVALFDRPTVAGLAAYLAEEYPMAVRRLWGAGSVALATGDESSGLRVDEGRIRELWAWIEPRRRGPVPKRKNPPALFVLSPPRSGSTLLRVMLGGHPKLFAPPELELLGFATLRERREAFAGRDAFRLEGLVRAVMEIEACGPEEAERWIAELEAAGASTAEAYGRLQERLGGRLLVDKTPTYGWDLETLRAAEELFEAPRYVHLVRHPHGMIHSFEEARLDEIFFHREHPFSRRELAELLWVVSHRNVLEHLRGVPAERQTTLRFEDLVRDPETALGEVCDLLGLKLHPAMLEPYRAPEGRMTDGVHPESRMLGDVKFHQHRRIDPAVADRWREHVTEDFLGDVTWELASALGYDAADRPGGSWLPLEPAGLRPGEPAPLSFAQERLWFLDRLDPGSAAYNIPAAFRLRGPLDAAALEQALATVVERHEGLRTRFAAGDGDPVQIVEPAGRFHLEQLDLPAVATRGDGELSTLVGRFSNRPFDLGQGGLFRACLVRLADEEHALLLAMHHAVADGWSIGVLFRELTAAYTAAVSGQAAELPELPIQYADYAVWQRAWLAGERLWRELSFWRSELDGMRPLDLPTDRPRPAVQTYRGAARPVAVAPGLAGAVTRLAREGGATPFMALAAAFAALLSRYSGQTDLTLGTPVANRTRAQTERLIGFFANTLVLRVDLDGRPGYRELVGRVRRRALGLYAHQEVPFEKVVEELRPDRDLSRSPLFQVMFALQNARGETGELPGLSVEPLRPGVTATKFELTLSVAEGPRGVVGGLEYNGDLFDPSTVDRMISHLRALLAAMAAEPDRPLAELPLLSAAERFQLVVEWNDSAVPAPRLATFLEHFAASAAARPDAVAVEGEGAVLSYRALDVRASRLARHLRSLGVGAGSRVALCLERSAEMVVAALAVMRSGAAYVPLDPDHPPERLGYVLEDSGAVAVVSEREVAARLAARVALPAATVLVDRDRERIAALPAEALSARPDPLALAYVIYTSGSTGRPKGVAVSHGALANFLVSMARSPGLGAEDALLAVTTFSFDIAGLELFLPLLVGGRVTVAPREAVADGARLAELIERSRATTLQGTPATWRLLLESGWRGDGRLRALCGGEALPRLLVRRLLPRVGSLWNLYGPTETTVWSSVLRLGVEGGPVPVGGPIAATSLHGFDAGLAPVPVGVAGELAIGGAGLARGYHGRPAQTAERFVPDPFATVGTRLYRTGDLVRRLPDGRLEFLGRIDHQVKIRGFRIELGEIEAVLAGHPGVEQAVAVVRGRSDGDRRLVAYVVARGEDLDPAALRRHTLDRLPEYMVPSVFVPMAALPLTPNGKVDRRALPELGDLRLGGAAASLPPRTETERRLAAIWEDVLGVEGVGARDDFFALGGHSLLLVRLNRRLSRDLGREVPVVDLFRHSTVEALAAFLDRTGGAEAAPLPPGVVRLRWGRPGPSPLFLVHPLSGELTLYRSLVEALPGERPVFGFLARGLEEGRAPDRRVEGMAERYAADLEALHPAGPVLLAGSSMGGLVAFEMARRLSERGREVGIVALIDTPEPDPGRRRDRRPGEIELSLLGYLVAGAPEIGLDELGAMARDERLAYVLRRGQEAGTLPAAFGLDELRRLVDVVEANQEAMEAYGPEPWDGQAVYVRASESSASERSGSAVPWSGLARGGVGLLEAQGNHITLHSPPAVDELAARIGERLEKADSGGGAAEVAATGVPGE
jgi:amino acid adenylation domain-containing protein